MVRDHREKNMSQQDHIDISQDIIDRLVDGELDEATRRAVLLRLEHDAILCRRIALAFLENQTWRDVFSNEVATSGTQTPRANLSSPASGIALGVQSNLDDFTQKQTTLGDGPDTANQSSPGKPYRHSRLLKAAWIFAVAASFVVTFLGSWYVQSVWFRAPANKPTIGALSQKSDNVSVPDGSHDIGSQEESSSSEPRLELVSVPLPIDEAGTWATLEVPFISSSAAEVAEMMPAGIPAEILESLSAQGHIVEQQRRFVPVSLPDGRQSIVPIDQVKIQFVGGFKK